jgi:hypothetical protein
VLKLGHLGFSIDETIARLQMPTLSRVPTFVKWLKENDMHWRNPAWADMSKPWDPHSNETNNTLWKLHASPSDVARDILDTDTPTHRPIRLSAPQIAKTLQYIEDHNQPHGDDDEDKEPVLKNGVWHHPGLPRFLLEVEAGVGIHVRSAPRAHPIASSPPRPRTASGASDPPLQPADPMRRIHHDPCCAQSTTPDCADSIMGMGYLDAEKADPTGYHKGPWSAGREPGAKPRFGKILLFWSLSTSPPGRRAGPIDRIARRCIYLTAC